jgi:archaeosine synthase beta-subunit
MVVLRTNGCSYDRGKTGCTMCDFQRHAIDPSMYRLNSDDLAAQLELAFREDDFPTAQLDLLTLGSFLHDGEVEPLSRIRLLSLAAEKPEIRKVVIESRAEYVTVDRLKSAKRALRSDQELELGLGVESSNDHIRNDVLRKSLAWSDVERVIHLCGELSIGFMSYLLVKPQTLTERAAIEDAVRSAQMIATRARENRTALRIALEPVFITQGTALEALFLRGEYRLVSLWSVIDVVLQIGHLGTVFVGLSDENLADGRIPRACSRCDLRVRAALEEFNGTQDLHGLRTLHCECKDQWRKQL